jgi:aminoglycoside 6-adenylyltransferase
LKKHLSPDVYGLLEQTYVGPRIADNWIALFDTIALFRRIAIEIADHFGYEYPGDMDDRVVAYLRNVEADTRGS